MGARTTVRWDWATEIATVLMLDCTCVFVGYIGRKFLYFSLPGRADLLGLSFAVIVIIVMV